MKLTITLTNKERSQEKDVQVNSQQKIADTLHILREADALWEMTAVRGKVKSLRRGLYLEPANNYEEEQVYTGDILEIQ
ncbi:MAG: hypothetical protein PHW34_08425 [Hespellia sp.]|nr:hypothetical protein [Hespellia sp.]